MNRRAITYDIKLLRGDPMLILSMAVPFILWALMTFIFPLVAEFVAETWAFDINPWFRNAGFFFMLLIPMMTGMVYGFILIDERDGGIITAISVTPAGKTGYLKLRLGIPMFLSFIFVILFQLLLGIQGTLGIVAMILLSALLSSQSLMMLLFLGAFADNKVMGMAIAKGFSVLLLGPLLDFILSPPLNWLGAYSPMFWPGRVFLSESQTQFWLYFLISLAIHIVIISILFRRFIRRDD
ncbi:MAG: hypothetical protein GY790_13495 [Bacteroidetes bacterium]|nr:hypothetical protein [Bacteroidota bacterium]